MLKHRQSHCYHLLLIMLMAAFAGLSQAEPRALNPSPPNQQLIESLRQGGYIIYLRHTTTDHTQYDQHPVVYDNCATQRPLSEEGEQQAIAIGQAFSRLAIPVGQVLSSPYCRTRQTATLAFNKATIKDFLAFSVNMNKAERQRATEQLRQVFIAADDGSNTVIVGHSGNLKELTGYWPHAEGITCIFTHNGQGYELVAQIKAEEWNQIK